MTDRPKTLITGATDGIGRLAAIKLACQGHDLILTARNKSKAADTREAIHAVAPKADVAIYHADFTDLTSVAEVGSAIGLDHPHIQVMINNAGLHTFQQRVTKDGFAEMISVNYLAPWLLTRCLRDTLVHSAPSRIVTVGSEASRRSGQFEFAQALRDTTEFTAFGSSAIYGRSKLFDIMFSQELARQLEDTDVAVNCLCPGFNVTGLGRELGFARPLATLLNWLNIGNPERGADLIVRLATDPEFGRRSGTYVSVKDGATLTPVAPANDEKARRALWQETEALLAGFL